MSILPKVSDKQAIKYTYFPTTWQAVVWRNWGYVEVARIAKALSTSVKNVKEAAKDLGLKPDIIVDKVWEKRGYLNIIRNNWHLCSYEQIQMLLGITAEELAFILKEDDFMWVKLGELKPQVDEPKYTPLDEAQKKRTEEIAKMFRDKFDWSDEWQENGFEFLEEFYRPLDMNEIEEVVMADNESLRMIYPYFALYGDTLLDDSADLLPDRLLQEYAKVGINGIWMQGLLYQLVEFPFCPSMSKGWEKRIANLKRMAQKAARYGIRIYFYFNEPRAMSEKFFEEYPHLRGEKEGDFYAMCTSTKEVQDYLYNGMKKLFTMVPELGGFFTITMSENLTNCYSRSYLAEKEGTGNIACPRCSERKPWEVVAEVNNLMAKGAHDAKPDAKIVVWTWGWHDAWAEKVIPLLTEGQVLQCTSEEAMKFCIGGVEGSVLDYTMSLCGPGEKAKELWKVARECGMQMSAKVQMNNSWEMAVVPYIPVFSKVEQHVRQLRAQGIQHLHTSWTLGGCPSPNLRLTSWLMKERGTLKEFLEDWLSGELAEGVYKAQQKLSDAFSHYPFHLNTLYFGPQNFGPMSPFFLEETGYRATMIGYPYDDIKGWCGIYPAEVYEEEYRQLVEGWREGLADLLLYEGQNEELDEMILMARAVLCQFESAYHHIQFVNRRDAILASGDAALVDSAAVDEGVADLTKGTADARDELRCIVHEEMDTVQTLINLRLQDSRIGFESSTHYFYTLQDLKEKMINLAYCEEKLK